MKAHISPSVFGLVTLVSALIGLVPANLAAAGQARGPEGFLRARDGRMVDGQGREVILRGMGLGGWMLQEGYMLGVSKEGTQHSIKARIKDLVGTEECDRFYALWLQNHMTRADVDLLAKSGFNSIRLPMHYNLFTLAIEDEPVEGQHTWLTTGFKLTDDLLEWCKANRIYLILDLHAAPGGQGKDANISDYDTNKPSLWESESNREKTIALWRKLAERYANEPWIGGYDLLNEPNWTFEGKDKNGREDTSNKPIWDLYQAITKAVREVDTNHMIIIEGNGWGNNYNGFPGIWDSNLAISFHKYWNPNTQEAIQKFLDLRAKYNVPIWLGESGENSNEWFRDCVALAEKNRIGWAWWPHKKIHTTSCILTAKRTDEFKQVLDYWNSGGPRPSREVAMQGLFEVVDNLKVANCQFNTNVVQALIQSRAETALDMSVPVRGLCMAAPNPGGVEEFVKFICEELAPNLVNTLILRVDFNYQYTNRAELADASGLSLADVRKIVAVCRTNEIRLIPQVNLLGHQSWRSSVGKLLQVYPEFDETPWVKDPDKYVWPNPDGLYCRSYCSLHPKVHDVVFPVVDEICDAFEADAFHAGMDEVFYIGEARCPRCGGKDKAKLFANEVERIRDHLHAKGRQLWIWGDRLLDGKATGLGEWEASMNDTHRAADLIPRDVVICDWHYERPDPTPVYFAMKGFHVVSCPWMNPGAAVQQLQDMVRFRKDSASAMKPRFQGVVQTVWSDAASFLRDYRGHRENADYKSGQNTAARCFIRLLEELATMKQHHVAATKSMPLCDWSSQLQPGP